MSRKITEIRWIVALAALAISGCGQVMPGLGRPAGGLGAFEDPASTLKDALREAVADLKTLSGRVTFIEIHPKDGKLHDSVATFKTAIEKSDKPNAKGAETLFLNDGKITVRVKIGFVPITRTFPLDDSQVTSDRNYRLDQTDFAGMVQTILAEGATVQALGPGELLGRKVDLLDVVPPGLPDVVHERFGLDPVTHLPVARVALAPKPGTATPAGPDLVTALTVTRMAQEKVDEHAVFSALVEGEKLNVDLPAGTWKF